MTQINRRRRGDPAIVQINLTLTVRCHRGIVRNQ